jgi:hypothetical protein
MVIEMGYSWMTHSTLVDLPRVFWHPELKLPKYHSYGEPMESFEIFRVLDIYYTKTSNFTSWDTPTKVIDRVSDSIRDPTAFVEGNYVYLFCQSYETNGYKARLYKILKAADFTDSGNYTDVGLVVDLGSAGQFDEVMAASPCVTKIGSTYYLAYEAESAAGIFSIGRAKTTSIESLPWTKDGQMKDAGGNVIYNPNGNTKSIVPDTFPDTSTLFCHYEVSVGGTWNLRYLKGDIANNSMTMCSSDIDPFDEYTDHANLSWVGQISGLEYFILQSWTSTVAIRLYRQLNTGVVDLNGHGLADFGDVRFTASDGTTLLDYWIERQDNGNYADCWVEVADSLSSVGTTIYIYYGKADATTTSSGANTFTFFDAFATLDTGEWTATIEGVGGTASVSSGELILNPTDDSISSASILSIDTYTNSIAIRMRRKYAAGTEFYIDTSLGSGTVEDAGGGTSGWHHTTLASGYLWLYQDPTNAANGLYRMPASGELVELQAHAHDIFDTNYLTHELQYSQNGVLGWVVENVVAAYSVTSTTFLNDAKTILVSQGEYSDGRGADSYLDWLLVRKYVSPEPAHSTWGAEDVYVVYVAGAGLSQASIVTLKSQVVHGAGASQDSVGKAFSQAVKGAGLGQTGTAKLLSQAGRGAGLSQSSIAELFSQIVHGAGLSQSSIVARISQVVNGAGHGADTFASVISQIVTGVGASVGAGLVCVSHIVQGYGSSAGAGIVRVSQIVHGYGASAATGLARVSQIVQGYGASVAAGLGLVSQAVQGYGSSIAAGVTRISQVTQGYGTSIAAGVVSLSQVVKGYGTSLGAAVVQISQMVQAYGYGLSVSSVAAQISQTVKGYGASAAVGLSRISQIVHGAGLSTSSKAVKIGQVVRGYGASVASKAFVIVVAVRGYGRSAVSVGTSLSQVVRGYGLSVASWARYFLTETRIRTKLSVSARRSKVTVTKQQRSKIRVEE